MFAKSDCDDWRGHVHAPSSLVDTEELEHLRTLPDYPKPGGELILDPALRYCKREGIKDLDPS